VATDAALAGRFEISVDEALSTKDFAAGFGTRTTTDQLINSTVVDASFSIDRQGKKVKRQPNPPHEPLPRQIDPVAQFRMGEDLEICAENINSSGRMDFIHPCQPSSDCALRIQTRD
jgi:hypothetical protein